MPEIDEARAYVTRSGLIVTGITRTRALDGFPIRARLIDRKGRVVEHWYTDQGHWSASSWNRSELDLIEVPPSERRA